MIRHRIFWLGSVAALAGISGALAAQESLLPPGFENPSPPSRPAAQRQVAPARGSAPAQPRPSQPAAQPAASAPAPASPGVATTSTPVVQPIPATAQSAPAGGISDEALLNSIDPALLARLIESARPKSDIPASGQRSLAQVGVIDQADGGLPALSTHYVNGPFVEGVIARTRGRFVSRWGHVLVRRALASRLATPVGLNGADWAAMRAQLLLRMGEADAARALV